MRLFAPDLLSFACRFAITLLAPLPLFVITIRHTIGFDITPVAKIFTLFCLHMPPLRHTYLYLPYAMSFVDGHYYA